LILGSNGQLGQCFESNSGLHQEYDFVFATRKNCDVTDYNALEEYIRLISPDYIINCIAYTAVDKAEIEIEQAYLINAQLPKNLALISTKLKCKLIHFSTDYVYNSESGYHTEQSPTNPCNVYGASKLKGDQDIIANSEDAIILRTSWVYSDRGNNFLLTMKRLMQEKKELKIVNDQIGAPTSTFSIVDAVFKIIYSYHRVDKNNRIFNFSDEGELSWYEFASKIQFFAGLHDCKLIPIPSSDYKTAAKRPLNSKMSKDLFLKTFELSLSSIDCALDLVI
jgi:dTDP-4-dehydrorhamnose reductase